MERNKRDRFVVLAEARVRKATEMLRLIGNLSNTGNYEYSREDVQKILSALETEMRRIRSRFEAGCGSTTKSDFKLG